MYSLVTIYEDLLDSPKKYVGKKKSSIYMYYR